MFTYLHPLYLHDALPIYSVQGVYGHGDHRLATEPVMNGSPVELIEVGPRDGLQNEAVPVDTATKLELIQRLLDAGQRRIEVTSFVNPKKVPQDRKSTRLNSSH